MRTSTEIKAEIQTLLNLSPDFGFNDTRQEAIGLACNALMWVVGDMDKPLSKILSPDPKPK